MATQRTRWRGARVRRSTLAVAMVGLLLFAAPGLLVGAKQREETFYPIGGGYTAATLEGFAQLTIERRSAATPDTSVDLLVVPSTYCFTPDCDDPDDDLVAYTEQAGERAQQAEDACAAVVVAPFTGCNAILLQLFSRAQAQDPANSAALAEPGVDGVFILGGDQTVAMRVLAGSPAEAALNGAFDRGAVFGGTSAGAAVQSRTMLAGYTADGFPDNALERGTVSIWWGDDGDTERGLIFGAERPVFDQHFYQRGRFGRLLNVVAESDEHFKKGGLLGVGVDNATGVAYTDDGILAGVGGDSSVAIVDFETARAAHRWLGPNQTLAARDVLTHILGPGAGLGYDTKHRRAIVDGRPRPWHPTGNRDRRLAFPAQSPGSAALILGGDIFPQQDPGWDGGLPAAFLDRAAASVHTRIIVVSANPGDIATANAYKSGLQTAGWAGTIDTIAFNSAGWATFDSGQFAGAAGILFVGRDQSLLGAALADGKFRALLRAALDAAPVVMTDRAMTATLGDWYVAHGEVSGTSARQAAAIAMFATGNANIQPGLGILPGFAFESRLTYDQRWGFLYALAQAHPETLVLGISEMTGIVLDPGAAGGVVAGERSVVVLDGRGATFRPGGSGTPFSAFNVMLDLFAPGERLPAPRGR